MEPPEVDEVDRNVLYMLQTNARLTATEIGDAIGVSDTTVRNRLDDLEADGVLRAYVPHIDYERAGLQRPFHFTCTVPIIEREEVAKQALKIPGIVTVTERMTGRENLVIEAVGEDPDDVTRIARQLTELGVDIIDETVVRSHHTTPLEYLAPEED